ncbi:hypothetical protein [Spirillospora sp. NPDC029432]|uniref:hypothetical protein n=1 Tax=Spirillospora sp. NPDC029432 TaxID=3154599 RepID=UPI003451F089
MDVRSSHEDQALVRLREEFGGHRIWRSIRSDGRLGEWVASLHDPAAGVTPTLMYPTPEQLRDALKNERVWAENRRDMSW